MTNRPIGVESDSMEFNTAPFRCGRIRFDGVRYIFISVSSSGMGIGVGENGNNQREWDGNGNEYKAKPGSGNRNGNGNEPLGMGWNGIKKSFPLISTSRSISPSSHHSLVYREYLRPHRRITYVDAAYCYRPSSGVCRSVCLSRS